MNATPNIFEFMDFRKYLSVYQEMRVKTDRSFTKSGICKKLGLPNTRSYFTDVLRDRPVTPLMTERLIKAFDLNREEARYFRIMVKMGQATIESERSLYLEQLATLVPPPKASFDKKSMTYFSHWYHSSVFSLLDIIDFQGDFGALAKTIYPPITPKQAEESIAVLIDLKIISKDKRGIWKPNRKSLSSGSYAREDLMREYHLQCLELSRQALIRPIKGHRNMSTLKFSASSQAYRQIEEALQKFKSELRLIVENDSGPSETVYHLNLHLFPNSR